MRNQEHSWFLKAFSTLGLFQRQSLAFTEPRSQFLTHLATGCKGGVQRSRATLCPEVNQHLWPSPHPGDCPSDGPLHSRHTLPQRKGFGTCPHKAIRTMTSRKPKSPTGSAPERSPRSPIPSLSRSTYNLLCTEVRDDELRERLRIFPWTHAFESLLRDLNCTKCPQINYLYSGTSLAFTDCTA